MIFQIRDVIDSHEGRPMGFQVMGKFGNDRRVLQFGLAYEQITSLKLWLGKSQKYHLK